MIGRSGVFAFGFALLVIVSVRPAPAQIDLTGEFGLTFLDICTVNITQNGTLIDFAFLCAFMQATASGTIDPVTGVFSGTGGCTVGPLWGALTITGTASPDSSSFAGGISCPPAIPGGPYAYTATRRTEGGPVEGCRTAGKSLLAVKNQADDSNDKLLWKWLKGEATTQDEFGMPTGTTSYSLCVYAGSSAACLAIPPSSSNWSAISDKGWKYKDSSGSANGVTKVLLKGGVPGKSKAIVKGKGANLPSFNAVIPVADGEFPVTVQLVKSMSDVCWESTFEAGDVIKNEGTLFKAKSD